MCVGQCGGDPPRVMHESISFSDKYFNLLARLVLGEMPVQRVNGMYLHRTSVRNFGQTSFGKRCCLHCSLTGETRVLLLAESKKSFVFSKELPDAIVISMPRQQ